MRVNACPSIRGSIKLSGSAEPRFHFRFWGVGVLGVLGLGFVFDGFRASGF